MIQLKMFSFFPSSLKFKFNNLVIESVLNNI